jgi:Cu/Ag efflux protein CusF
MNSRIFIVLIGCLVMQACNQPAQEQAAVPAEEQAAGQVAPAVAEEDIDYVEGVFASPQSATGEVMIVNADTVQIKHGPVVALNWPAMTMTYEVRDPAVIAGLQPGQQVEFTFQREDFAYILREVTPQ